ncbi:MAG: hypothetical protein ACEQR8_11395 [Cypionkella sp.]
MSDPLEQQLREDRVLRDAARAILDADVANLRASLAGRSIPTRIADRVSEGAQDAMDEAAHLVTEHKGLVAAAVAALLLWLVRHPLLALVLGNEHEQQPE